MTWLWLGWVGCGSSTSTDAPPVDAATQVGHEGTGTGDTGGPGLPTASPSRGPWVPLDPAVRVIGDPGQDLGGGGVVAFPASDGLPGVLFASWATGYDPDLPVSLILPGVLAHGAYGVRDVWDGVSGWMGDVRPEKFHLVGDEDGDGFRDAWLHDALYSGPFLGRRLGDVGDPTRIAWFDGGYEGVVVAGGFDADRDGHDDVAVMVRSAVIYYGPFAGQVPGLVRGEAPAGSVTQLAADSCWSGGAVATVLKDHLGPDHPAIAVCSGSGGAVFDLWQPRGGVLTEADGLAFSSEVNWYTPSWFDDAGDLDGDGHPDVLWSPGYSSKIPASPLSGSISDEDAPTTFSLARSVWLDHAIGDLNGDGVQELSGTCRDATPEGPWVTILFSPHEDPLDLCAGLPIGPAAEVTRSVPFGETHADLDGDGLEDVVGWFKYHDQMSPPPPPEWIGAGEVRIWYGEDLWAAEQARQRARGPS